MIDLAIDQRLWVVIFLALAVFALVYPLVEIGNRGDIIASNERDLMVNEELVEELIEKEDKWADQYANIRGITETVIDYLNENGLEYMLIYGTLLGWYREGDIIRDDNDADLLVPRESFEVMKDVDWSELGLYSVTQGSILQLNRNPMVQVDKQQGGMLDVYCLDMYEEGGEEYVLDKWNNWAYRKDLLYPLRRAEFLGRVVRIPNQTVRLLTYHYDNFMEPVHHFKRFTFLGLPLEKKNFGGAIMQFVDDADWPTEPMKLFGNGCADSDRQSTECMFRMGYALTQGIPYAWDKGTKVKIDPKFTWEDVISPIDRVWKDTPRHVKLFHLRSRT